MKIAKVLFVLGAVVFPVGIYLSSYSTVGVVLAIVGGLTVFLSTPAIQS
ncbi:hypothetical protein [Bacillus timonensis]|nr:hypothetical protein [Bacillus timonensis]